MLWGFFRPIFRLSYSLLSDLEQNIIILFLCYILFLFHVLYIMMFICMPANHQKTLQVSASRRYFWRKSFQCFTSSHSSRSGNSSVNSGTISFVVIINASKCIKCSFVFIQFWRRLYSLNDWCDKWHRSPIDDLIWEHCSHAFGSLLSFF